MEAVTRLKAQLDRVLSSRYQIGHVLGQGGAATVFKAHDLELDRDVAIKVVQSTENLDTRSARRFEYEAKIMARLDHPNLVRVLDYGTTAREAFLIVEFVDGISLGQFLEGGRILTIPECLTILFPVVAGLEAAHSANVIHRDLKPDNILLDSSQAIKIMDFGLAHGPDRGFETQPGIILGTLPFMAPEQLGGDVVGPAADFYSLGIILYRMLTGHLPHEGTSESAIIKARIAEPPPALFKHVPGYPAWLETMVAGLLDRDSKTRWSNAGHIRLHIESSTSRVRPAATIALQHSKSREATAPDPLTQEASSTGSTGRKMGIGRKPSLDLRHGGGPEPSKRVSDRNFLPIPGLLIAVSLGSFAAYMLRSPVEIKDLVITISPTVTVVRGTVGGGGRGNITARETTTKGMQGRGNGKATSATQTAVVVQVEGRPSEGLLVLELNTRSIPSRERRMLTLSIGDDKLAEIQLPVMPQILTPGDFSRLTLEIAGLEELEWEMRLSGGATGSSQNILGDRNGSSVTFSDAANLRWDRIILESITGAGHLIQARSDKQVSLVIQIKPEINIPTLAGLNAVQEKLLTDRSPDVVKPLISEVEDLIASLTTDRGGRSSVRGDDAGDNQGTGDPDTEDQERGDPGLGDQETNDRDTGHRGVSDQDIVEAFRDTLRSRTMAESERNQIYLWMAKVGLLTTALKDWGRPPSLNPEEAFRPYISVRRHLFAGDSSTLDGQVLGFVMIGESESFGGVDSLQTIAQGYMVDGVWPLLAKPSRPDRPKALSVLSDLSSWKESHQVRILQTPDQLPTRATLEISIWNCVRHQYFLVEFPGERSLPPFYVTNPDDLGTPTDPENQDIPYPDQQDSWLNLSHRAITVTFTLNLPTALRSLPQDMIITQKVLPGARKVDSKWAAFLGARWLTSREASP